MRLPLPLRASILSDEGPTLMTSFNFKYFLTTASPNAVTLGVIASMYESQRSQFSLQLTSNTG